MIHIKHLVKALGLTIQGTIAEVGVNSPRCCRVDDFIKDGHKVLLVEPLARHAHELRAQYEAYSVTVIEKAIVDEPGPVFLVDRDQSSTCSRCSARTTCPAETRPGDVEQLTHRATVFAAAQKQFPIGEGDAGNLLGIFTIRVRTGLASSRVEFPWRSNGVKLWFLASQQKTSNAMTNEEPFSI
jgi:hypothetical protein